MSTVPLPTAPPRRPDDEELRHRVKRELRKRAQSLRKATPLEACAQRSARIVERLLALDVVRSARSFGLFWPITDRHEVDLRALDLNLRARGARIAYPAIDVGTGPGDDPGGEPHRMNFRFVDDTAALEERGFGFAEPSPSCPSTSNDLRELDVVIVPALGIDPLGQRIGYGAGYYDRALAGAVAIKVGVVFDFQLVSEVPATLGDIPVDWVVSDARVIGVAMGV